MSAQPLPHATALPASVRERVDALLRSGGRQLLGLVGPPGAGKSTLAAQIHAAYPKQSVVVPMDGFHLANVQLKRLGRHARKGAPDTFDADGYLALLRRLQQPSAPEVIYAPEFLREMEEPIAGAIAVEPDTPLVITEGNYLLLQQGAWSQVQGLLSQTWYVAVNPELRLSRLLARHMAFGRQAEEAQAWIQSTDEPNARLVEACRSQADWVFTG